MKSLKIFVAMFLVMAMASFASAGNMELSKSSTLNTILKNKELRIGFNASYPPFEMTDKKGNYIGFDVDLGKEIAKSMGVKATFINTDFDGLIPALLSNKFDIIISGMTLTQSRNMKVSFSDPYVLMGQGVMVNAKKKDGVKFYRDLNKADFQIVSCIGTTGEEAVKKYLPKAQYKSFDQPSDAAQEVISGRADAFVYDLHVLEVLQKRQAGDKSYLLDEPFTFEPMAIAYKQGDPDFTNFINNFLFQFKSDGRYERIHFKWLESKKWESLIDG
ncbi:MAG: transporter substrate-binding domain-containing protein [Desulfotalea sp.]